MNKRLLIALSGLVLGLSGCGEQSPAQAFDEWRNAIVSGKIDAANELTADDPTTNTLFAEAVKDNVAEGKILKSGTVVAENVEGDKAIIKMKGPDGKTIDFVMLKSQGKWKLVHKQQK